MLQVIFLFQLIFVFILFQIYQHILTYPKTKEKRKLTAAYTSTGKGEADTREWHIAPHLPKL